jgi:hypothetical protein
LEKEYQITQEIKILNDPTHLMMGKVTHVNNLHFDLKLIKSKQNKSPPDASAQALKDYHNPKVKLSSPSTS